jgi:hypothetical protein
VQRTHDSGVDDEDNMNKYGDQLDLAKHFDEVNTWYYEFSQQNVNHTLAVCDIACCYAVNHVAVVDQHTTRK